MRKILGATIGSIVCAASALADVATDITFPMNPHLFYVEGSELLRAACADDAVYYDRQTCNGTRHRVPLGETFQTADADIGQDVPTIENRLRDLVVRVGQIDNRLSELANVDPTPARPELLQQIAAKRQSLAEAEVTLAELRDQIVRIKERLSEGDNPDLRDQLSALEVDRGQRQQAANTLQKELADLRQAYIEANASVIDPSTYQDLQQRRRMVVSDFDSTRDKLDAALKKVVELARLERQILDQSFTTDRLNHNSDTNQHAAVVAIARAFEAKDMAARTFPVTSPDQRQLQFGAGSTSGFERLTCRVASAPGADCQVLKVTAPDGRSVIAQTFVIEIRTVDHYVNDRHLEPLLEVTTPGVWTIAPACDDLPSTGPLLYGYDCFLRVQPR